MMRRLYDKDADRLVCFAEKASSEYWDKYWSSDDMIKHIKVKNSLVPQKTLKYLPKGSKILEGGCGRGNIVWNLKESGFKVTGVDFAEKTVAQINEVAPELDVIVADVFDLPFEDNSFDGYWSLGVMEHFYDGYQKIVEEMYRVVRPGGYVFFAAPAISPFQKMMIKLKPGNFPVFEESQNDLDSFYQFFVNVETVRKDFEEHGFKLLEKHFMGVVFNILENAGISKPAWKKLQQSSFIPFKVVKRLMEMSFNKYCGHSVVLVLKKL